MRIEVINVLSGQEAALRTPAGSREEEVYRERVDEPSRPFREPVMRFMPRPSTDQGGGAPSETTLLGFYGPDVDAGEGLGALAKFEEAGSFASCMGALEGAAEALARRSTGSRSGAWRSRRHRRTGIYRTSPGATKATPASTA